MCVLKNTVVKQIYGPQSLVPTACRPRGGSTHAGTKYGIAIKVGLWHTVFDLVDRLILVHRAAPVCARGQQMNSIWRSRTAAKSSDQQKRRSGVVLPCCRPSAARITSRRSAPVVGQEWPSYNKSIIGIADQPSLHCRPSSSRRRCPGTTPLGPAVSQKGPVPDSRPRCTSSRWCHWQGRLKFQHGVALRHRSVQSPNTVAVQLVAARRITSRCDPRRKQARRFVRFWKY